MDQNRPGAKSHYRARTLTWSITVDEPQIRSLIDEIFADLVVPEPAEDAHFDVRRAADPSQLELVLDAHDTAWNDKAYSPAQLIDQLVSFVNHGILDSATGTLDLHASALTSPNNALTIMATAPSGGGKTTIAAHLCRAGWSYLSDETVGIRFDDGTLVGCGKPLTVKRGLRDTLGIDLGPLTIDDETQSRWYVRPALLGGSVTATTPAATDLVFIDFDHTAAATDVRQVPPHQALMQLLPNTYNLERHGVQVLPTLARLVAKARIWEVRTADGADAVDQLLAAIGQVSPPDRNAQHHTALEDAQPVHGPVQAPGTVFAGFEESGAVVHDHVRSKAVALDRIGAMVWQLLDGSVSMGNLASELAEHFDEPATTIHAHVESLCRDLVGRGFLIEPDSRA